MTATLKRADNRQAYVQLVPDRFGAEQWLVVRPTFHRGGKLAALKVLDRYDNLDDAEHACWDFNISK